MNVMPSLDCYVYNRSTRLSKSRIKLRPPNSISRAIVLKSDRRPASPDIKYDYSADVNEFGSESQVKAMHNIRTTDNL